MKPSNTFKGLTPEKIKKAVQKYKPEVKENIIDVKSKQTKPKKQMRLAQVGDNACLLNLPFATTQTASLYYSNNKFSAAQVPKFSIIVPIYNTNADKLIRSWDIGDTSKAELIFIDDNCPANSKDQVIESMIGLDISYSIYSSSIKQGWEACCNIGAEKSSSDILIFLHPNVILTENWSKPLIEIIKEKEVGAISPIQIEVNSENISNSGFTWNWKKESFLKFGREIYKNILLSKPFTVDNCPKDLFCTSCRDSVSSYCMVTKKKTFQSVGGFCPRISSPEWSGADYCMSLKEKGMKVLSENSIQIFLDPILQSGKNYDVAKMYFRNKWLASGRMNELVENKGNYSKNIESIVIRRGFARGDVLMASSVAPALKKKYPKAKIIFSTDCPEVLENNPNIDKVVEMHTERFFNLYFDLDMAYEYKPQENIINSYSEVCGVPVSDCHPFIHKEIMEGMPKKYVVIHAGKTMWVGRDWTSVKFDIIAKKIKSLGIDVVCVGSNSDHKTPCDIDLRDKTSVHQLAGVIAKSVGFVGIDSFPMHVAQCQNVPGVCFFGSVDSKTRLYSKKMKAVFSENLSCLGCHNKKSVPCTSTVICENGVQDCVNNVTVEQMWQAIISVIQT